MGSQLRILSKRFAVVGLAASLLAGCIATEDDFLTGITQEKKVSTVGGIAISFNDNNDGNANTKQNSSKGAIINLPRCELIKENYQCAGWSYNPDNETTDFIGNEEFTVGKNDVTLYAVWKKLYKVTFDPNGGTGSMEAQFIAESLSSNLKQVTFTKPGYNFSGWSSSPEGAASFLDQTSLVMSNSDLTLYAVWTQKPVYQVSFDSNSGINGPGGPMLDLSIAEGNTVSLRENTFVNSGFVFGGWSITETGDPIFADQAPYTMGSTNVTLYAQWNAINQVIFNANGGQGVMDSQEIIEGSSDVLNDNTYSNPGYSFKGWSISSNGPIVYNNNEIFEMGNSSLVLYAIWEQNPLLSLNFEPNGGVGAMDAQDLPSGASGQITKNLFERSGYEFKGWSTSPNGEISYSDLGTYTMANTGDTLYAVWRKKPFSLGRNHSLIIINNELWVAGDNYYGQLGLGAVDETSVHNKVPTTGGVLKVAANMAGWDHEHSLFIKTDGSLWGMGKNSYDQLGNSASSVQKTPIEIIANDVKEISAGYKFSVFIKDDGSLWGIGENRYGQLGTGDTTDRSVPVEIVSSGVIQVAAGLNHTIFLKSDGSLYTMGYNSDGQLGTGDKTQHTTPQKVEESQVIYIAAGYDNSFFIMADGQLYGMGDNYNGQLGVNDTNDKLSPVRIVNSGVIAVAAGMYHTIFLTDTGILWGMGDNDYGQLGLGITSETFLEPQVIVNGSVTAIEAGIYDTIFLKENDKLWVTGRNDYGQLGDGSTSKIYEPEELIILTH